MAEAMAAICIYIYTLCDEIQTGHDEISIYLLYIDKASVRNDVFHSPSSNAATALPPIPS